MSGPRLVLDPAACHGHGICALRCPERISLDEWGFARIDPTPLARRRELARARLAAAACPRHALALETAPPTTTRPVAQEGE